MAKLREVTPGEALTSALGDEFGAQDEPLDAFIAAVDFLRVVGQLDRLDQRSAFQRLPGTLHGQVLDQRYLIAIREKIAHGIANLDMVGLLPLALQLTRRDRKSTRLNPSH